MPLEPGDETYNEKIIANFRENRGRVTIPPFERSDLLLLTTTGARSGEPRTSSLGYTRDGGRYVVVGSNSGRAVHADWVGNIRRRPIVTLEVGPETFQAHATIEHGAERDRLFDAHATVIPQFRVYEGMTDRLLPVVTFERIG